MSLRGAFVVAPSHIVQARNENNLAAQPVARTGEGDAARTPRHECRRRRTPACGVPAGQKERPGRTCRGRCEASSIGSNSSAPRRASAEWPIRLRRASPMSCRTADSS